MAVTTLSDVNFLSEPFKDTLLGEFTHKLELYNSMLQKAPDNFVSPNDRGYKVAIPKWETVTTQSSPDSVQITTGLTTTFSNLPDYKDEAVWVEREKAWAADTIIMTVAGPDKDVTREVARQLGQYWAKEVHTHAISVLQGVFGTALANDHAYDDSLNTINVPGLINAKKLLGDNAPELTSITMHSKPYYDAVSDKILVYDRYSQPITYANSDTGAILGMQPFVTDQLAVSAGIYSCYLGLMGSMIYQLRERPTANYNFEKLFNIGNIEVEIVRIATTNGGQDGLISRASFLAHVPGVAVNTNITSNPTEAETATAANWTKVANDDKLIKIIQYKCK